MRIRKSLLTFVLLICAFVCLAVPQPVSADDDIMPQNLYTRKLIVAASIDVVTNVLTADISVSTMEKCDIYTTMDVYKYIDGNWEFYTSFRNPRTGVYTGQSKLYSDSCSVEGGYDYKIIAKAYVTSVEDQISEVVSQSTGILPYE